MFLLLQMLSYPNDKFGVSDGYRRETFGTGKHPEKLEIG